MTKTKEVAVPLYEVKLTNSELLHLDGKCSREVQAVIDQRKVAATLSSTNPALTQQASDMIAKIVSVAKTEGQISFCAVPIQSCPTCGRNDGYYVHTRNSRHHSKGSLNYDAPKIFTGYDIHRRFITIRNSISTGWCASCDPIMRPAVIQALDGVEAEIPKALTGEDPKYLRFGKRECECGWRGHEGQMGKLRTLMGDGYYRGKCPKCGAENSLFVTKIKSVDGFVVVPNTKEPCTS